MTLLTWYTDPSHVTTGFIEPSLVRTYEYGSPRSDVTGLMPIWPDEVGLIARMFGFAGGGVIFGPSGSAPVTTASITLAKNHVELGAIVIIQFGSFRRNKEWYKSKRDVN